LKMTTQVGLWLLLLFGVAMAAPSPPVPAVVPHAPETTKSRFQSTRSDVESDSAHKVGAGGEWWVKDPPWFLPPPPEWGPMPPTMYTSYFHKPRYPSLSTANYYPLYSRSDEYDAHLPASMSRRAAFTQQQIYDHYVSTYRDHTRELLGGPSHSIGPAGDPNVGVSNPTLYSNTANIGALGEAHGRALGMQSPNNYFPLFAGSGDHGVGHSYPGAFVGANGPRSAFNSWLEVASTSTDGQQQQQQQLMTHSGMFGGRAVTYFASSHVPTFKPMTDADVDADAHTETDADEEADEGEDEEAEDAEESDE